MGDDEIMESHNHYSPHGIEANTLFICEECLIKDKKIKSLNNQIKRMRSWKNCAHEVDSDGCDKAGNLDGSCPCDKWELMK